MQPIPQRVSLIVQTQQIIAQGIHEGRWRGRLPGERKLSLELQVSRWTLRAALTLLARQSQIQIAPGQACLILRKAKLTSRRKRSPTDWQVGLVSPEPLWRLRPFVALWFNALASWLQAKGGELHLYAGASYFGRGGEAALAKLTQQSPHDGWGLLLSTHAMQRWFRDRGLPVVVIGSSFEELDLPSVDLAYRAVGRHAAGVLLSHGHRRIAWLSSNVTLAGVIECERGFREAFAAPGNGDAELIVCHHAGAPSDVCQTLDRLQRRASPPSAIYLQQSNSLLTTLSYLAQKGRSIPRDVSVIVAEDEPYFPHLLPEMAHYASEPEMFARRLGRFLRQATEGTLPKGTHAQIMPTFVAGRSVARA